MSSEHIMNLLVQLHGFQILTHSGGEIRLQSDGKFLSVDFNSLTGDIATSARISGIYFESNITDEGTKAHLVEAIVALKNVVDKVSESEQSIEL